MERPHVQVVLLYLLYGWTRKQTAERLGLQLYDVYLTPEEYDYVLTKRAIAFGEHPEMWFTSPQATRHTPAASSKAKTEKRPSKAAAPSRAVPLSHQSWTGMPSTLAYSLAHRPAELWMSRTRPCDSSTGSPASRSSARCSSSAEPRSRARMSDCTRRAG